MRTESGTRPAVRGVTALRHGVITAAFALAVFATGQAMADDSLTHDSFLAIDQTPLADDSDKDSSLWLDLRQLFSDTTVAVGAAPRSESQSLRGDPGYNAYATINVDGFTVGGHFARWSETAFSEGNQQSFGVGASYTMHSWTVGIDWSRGNYDEVFLNVDSGETSDVIAFTSSYAVRPGVKINGLLEYSDEQPADVRSAPGAFTVGVGTLINF
ncbi:MAG TPA: porin [Candidatus Acidoferrum sp.]|nr:porin [Candidatus Acidoferrum sp.]